MSGADASLASADQAALAKLMELPEIGEGDFLLKPPFADAPELTPRADVPKGKILRFSLSTAASRFYPDTGLKGSSVLERHGAVYIPSQYVPGTPAPVLVTQDSMGNGQLPTILDNMISDHRLPAIVVVMMDSGGNDGPGSERGLEYDTVSGKFAEFIEAEVLPVLGKAFNITFTQDPDGRATMGGSSGGTAAFSMAWFHPELYHRVLAYSGAFVNQQSPVNPALPLGAWEYHEHLLPQSAPRPLRVWLEVGGDDIRPNDPAETLHNWVLANQRMAAVLRAKGYHYQFVYAVGAGHVDGRVVRQTLPRALEWLWQGYQPAK